MLLFSLRSNIYAQTSYGSEDDARHVLSVRTARAHALIRTRAVGVRACGRAGVRACGRAICLRSIGLLKYSPTFAPKATHGRTHGRTHTRMHACSNSVQLMPVCFAIQIKRP